MTKEESLNLIKKRLENEPGFKKAYDEYLVKIKADRKLNDDHLLDVNGGFLGIENCPNCGNHTLTTLTFGIYAFCTECDYTEWFIG